MIKTRLARLKFATLLVAIYFSISLSSAADSAAATADSLESSNWQLIRMTVLGGYEFIPEDSTKYVLNFRSESRLTGTSDCNNLSGLWIQDGLALRFEPLNSGRKLCAPGSLHNNFALYLRDTQAFTIVDGNLLLSTTIDEVELEFESR